MRLVIVFLCFFSFIPVQAMACSCTQDSFTDEASQKNISKAAFIFEGDAVKIKKTVVAQYFSEVTFRIDALYKGDEDVQDVKALVDTKTSCGLTSDQLRRQTFFMLYAHKDQYILAGHCGTHISESDRALLKRGAYLIKK